MSLFESSPSEKLHAERSTSAFSTRTLLILTLAGCALLLIPTIFWNFTYDQGTFAYGGSAILRGEKPYLDFWDIKPPNIFYTYAAAFAILGESVRSIRVFDYLNALLSIGLLFTLSCRLWKSTPWRHTAAVIASLAFVLQFYILGDWNTSQVESYSLPFLIGSLLLVVPPRDKDSFNRLALRASLAGVAISIAFFYKFTNGIYLGLDAAALWIFTAGDRKTHYRSLATLVAGFSAGIAVQVIYMWVTGEFAVLWHITTSSTLSYVGSNYSGSFSIFQNVRQSLFVLDLLWVVIGAMGWSVWASSKHARREHTHPVFLSGMILLLGLVLSYITIQLQNKGYSYHYLVMLPWANILIGAGIGHIVRVLSKIDQLPRVINAAILVVALFLGSYLWTSRTTLPKRVREFSQIVQGKNNPNGYIATDTLANYVIHTTQPRDSIFIFGFQPYVYWKSGRHPSNRYLNTIHFKPTYVPREERAELVHSLTTHPPKLFLIEMGERYTSQGNTNDDSRTTIKLRYPEIEQLLAERYTIRDTVQNTIAYFLK